VEAHYHRAEIKTFRRGDPDLAALEKLATRDDLPAKKTPYVHFALARACEDVGDYATAFRHLRKGNDSKRLQINYDEPRVSRLFQRIMSVFDRALLDRFEGSGDPSETPIFVLGMPRSGSTLIEQILAGHPQIHAAGELGDLENACKRPAPFPECIPALDASALLKIGQDYLARMQVLANGQTRVVNKLPDNFLRIGLIRLILPNARIIHTVRDPIDTCVSCYSKLFASGQHFSYELGELGRYYRRYCELMDHWVSILPSGAMLKVSYEDVVNDVEGQARRLIEYCGLPWDDRCVSFHKTTRPVKTASAVQVRKPLFRSSLQRWRKYKSAIGPLLQALGVNARLSAEDFHHVRPADAVQFGAEFPVGTDPGGHVEDYGKVA
jgi:Sulfotransferase family